MPFLSIDKDGKITERSSRFDRPEVQREIERISKMSPEEYKEYQRQRAERESAEKES